MEDFEDKKREVRPSTRLRITVLYVLATASAVIAAVYTLFLLILALGQRVPSFNVGCTALMALVFEIWYMVQVLRLLFASSWRQQRYVTPSWVMALVGMLLMVALSVLAWASAAPLL